MAARDMFLLKVQNNSSEKTFINYYRSESNGFSISFRNFFKVCDEISAFLSEFVNEEGEFIGLFLSDYLWLPCLLLCVWKTGNACACIGTQISLQNSVNFLNFLGVQLLITDSEKPPAGALLTQTFCINFCKFYIWRRNSDSFKSRNSSGICYGITTSGSTGNPKIIRVPWSCILPNIYELAELLKVDGNDNVYLSSPCTFDPFFVELLISLLTGCTLTIVSPSLKLSSESLLKILFQSKNYIHDEPDDGTKSNIQNFQCKTSRIENCLITFLQMTPSIFKRWSNSDISSVVLSPSSTLRTLLLGGEKFPMDVLNLKCLNNKTNIFNIYGITEISCWAFINNLTNGSDNASLGSPLNGIHFKIDENNELLIGSKARKCLIDDEEMNLNQDEVLYRKTGDLVSVECNNVYYVSRTDQVVKKFGIRINLEKILKDFLNIYKEFQESVCIFDDVTLKVALFLADSDMKEGAIKIEACEYPVEKMRNITSMEKPDYVCKMRQFPLNSNGKHDRRALLKIFRSFIKEKDERSFNLEDEFRKIWMQFSPGKNFIHSGGDSVKVLQMITSLEELDLEVPTKFFSELLEHGEYEQCLSCLKESNPYLQSQCKRVKLETKDEHRLDVLWSFDSGKCIDASPVVVNIGGMTQAIVGSHSHRLLSMNLETGEENWTILLGDRIESGFCLNNSSTLGYIGCYDHHVYCISTSDGGIIWKFKTGDMIKSTPCVSSDQAVVFVASYDTHLYCLGSSDGSLRRKLKLNTKGIFSSGVLSDQLRTFYIATLDGTCVCLDQTSCSISWKHKLDSPVFASPVLINRSQSIVFAEVTGCLHGFDAKNGRKIWKYECNSCVYATPVHCPLSGELFVGCYDRHLYFLKLEKDGIAFRMKIDLNSPIFAKPCLYSVEGTHCICVATTEGFIYLCHLESGSVMAQAKLNGELFSSPVINNRNLVIGCRDNKLYCFEIRINEPR